MLYLAISANELAQITGYCELRQNVIKLSYPPKSAFVFYTPVQMRKHVTYKPATPQF